MGLSSEWFGCWWEPHRLFKQTQVLCDAISSDRYFNDPTLKPLREAYMAAKFAALRGLPVRLVSEKSRFPDFEILCGEKVYQFEQTVADRKGRQRGREYREAAQLAASGAPRQWTHYDPDEEMAAAIPAISDAIARKAKKNYQPKPNLLVYVNFSTDRGKPPLTDIQAVQLAEQYGASFVSIWLLWGDNAVPLLAEPGCANPP